MNIFVHAFTYRGFEIYMFLKDFVANLLACLSRENKTKPRLTLSSRVAFLEAVHRISHPAVTDVVFL